MDTTDGNPKLGREKKLRELCRGEMENTNQGVVADVEWDWRSWR